MKRIWVLLIAILVVVVFVAADIYLQANPDNAASADKEAFADSTGADAETVDVTATQPAGTANADTVAAAGTDSSVSSSSGSVDSTMGSNTGSTTDSSVGGTAASGTAIDTKLLVDNLDKVSDETISYVYRNSSDNVTIGNMYEGNFTNSGKPELLVIFKLLKVPHAGGLDCSVAAVYDRNSLGIITQKTFPYDECKFNIVADDAQRSFLLFIGSTTYQGYSQYTLGLWKIGKVWEQLFPTNPGFMDNKRFDLKNDGNIWVSHSVFDSPKAEEMTWLHEYNLSWNKATRTLDDTIPQTYKDGGGNPNVDAVSVSPDGKYAISTHHDRYRVLLYDVVKNKLAADLELLAQDYGFMWSPDSSKVCVSKAARIWTDVSFIDVGSGKVIELPPLYDAFKDKGVRMNYVMNENRPDPYISPIEWSPDNRRILLFYQWTDSAWNRQSGTLVFDTVSRGVSKIKQNRVEPEGGNLPAKKPEGFNW